MCQGLDIEFCNFKNSIKSKKKEPLRILQQKNDKINYIYSVFLSPAIQYVAQFCYSKLSSEFFFKFQ